MQTFKKQLNRKPKLLVFLFCISFLSFFSLSSTTFTKEPSKVFEFGFKDSKIRAALALKHYILLENQKLETQKVLGHLKELRKQAAEIKQHLFEWDSILWSSSDLLLKVAQANQRVAIERKNNWRFSKEILLYLFGFKWFWGLFTNFSPSTSSTNSLEELDKNISLFNQQHTLLSKQLLKKQEVIQSALTKIQDFSSSILPFLSTPTFRQQVIDFLNTFLVLTTRFIAVSQVSLHNQTLLFFSLSQHSEPTVMLALDNLESMDYSSTGLLQEQKEFLKLKQNITNQLNKTLSSSKTSVESASPFSLESILGGLNYTITSLIEGLKRDKKIQGEIKERLGASILKLEGFTNRDFEYFIYPQVPVTLSNKDTQTLLQELEYLEKNTVVEKTEKELTLLREVEEFKGLTLGAEDLLQKTFLIETKKILIDDFLSLRSQLHSEQYVSFIQNLLLLPLWSPNIFCSNSYNHAGCNESFTTPDLTLDSASFKLQELLEQQELKIKQHLRQLQEFITTSQDYFSNLLFLWLINYLDSTLKTLLSSRRRRFNLLAQASKINLFRRGRNNQATTSNLLLFLQLNFVSDYWSASQTQSNKSSSKAKSKNGCQSSVDSQQETTIILYPSSNELRTEPRVLTSLWTLKNFQPNYRKVLENNLRIPSNLWEVFSSLTLRHDSLEEQLGLLEGLTLTANKLTAESKTRVKDSIKTSQEFDQRSAFLLVVQQLIGNVEILLPHQREGE